MALIRCSDACASGWSPWLLGEVPTPTHSPGSWSARQDWAQTGVGSLVFIKFALRPPPSGASAAPRTTLLHPQPAGSSWGVRGRGGEGGGAEWVGRTPLLSLGHSWLQFCWPSPGLGLTVQFSLGLAGRGEDAPLQFPCSSFESWWLSCPVLWEGGKRHSFSSLFHALHLLILL